MFHTSTLLLESSDPTAKLEGNTGECRVIRRLEMGDAEGRRRLVGSHRGVPTYINLKVKSPDGHEVYFNEMRSSQLRRVMVVSCERLSLEFNDIRFVYKGHCVSAEDTPDQLRMKDGDAIDAFSVQPRNQLTARPAMINVVVNGQDGLPYDDVLTKRIALDYCYLFSGDAHIVYFRMKKSTQLNRLMTAYCDERSIHINCYVFLWTGRRLHPDQTPDELEMEDGEEIYVMRNFPLCENCRQLE